MHAPTKTKTHLEMQEPCDCEILTTHIACEHYPFVLVFFFIVGKKVQGASGLISSPLIKLGTLPKGIRATRSNKGLSRLYTSIQVKSLLENVDLSFGSWTSRPITIFHFFCLPILNGYLKTMWPTINKIVQWHIKYFLTQKKCLQEY